MRSCPVNNRFKVPIMVRILYWLFVFFSFVFCIELIRRNLSPYFPHDWPNAHENDILTNWKVARLSKLGINPYTSTGLAMLGQGQVGQPPTMSFWYLPFVDLPKAAAAEISSLSLLALLFPHYYLCAKELRWPAPIAIGAIATSLVISTDWLAYHYNVIQCSEQIAFLYLLAWMFLRRGKDATAGICIGVAMTLKLFPGLMLIMLFAGRRWRGVATATLTYAVVAITMTLKFGFSAWLLFLEQEKPVTEGWLGSLQNSSLSGLVAQILFPVCEVDPHPSKTGSMITAIVSVILVAAAIWFSRHNFRRARQVDRRAIDLPFALFVTLSVFLNPFAWEHYYAMVMQPLFILTTLLWHTFRATLRRWSDRACTTVSFVFTSLFTAVSVATLAFVLIALSRDIWSNYRHIEVWKRAPLSVFHWHFHYTQVQNFAPWVASLVLCFALQARRNRTGLTTT